MILQDSWSQFWKFGRFFGSFMVAEGETPTFPEASAMFFRPQINTDWHRLRAKALSESPGNHRYRLTSVYQPERVTQGTCPCDTFPNLVKCKKQLLTTLRLLFLHYSNTFITFAPKKIQYNDKQRRSTAFS